MSIDLYNRTKAEFHHMERMNYRYYLEMAIREVLINAISHREYGFGGTILINIPEFEWNLSRWMNWVKMIFCWEAQCWNEKLAVVFYRLKLIEAYGTGIGTI